MSAAYAQRDAGASRQLGSTQLAATQRNPTAAKPFDDTAAAATLTQPGSLGRIQQQQIEKLRKDHERLKEELALETRSAKYANNSFSSKQINLLQDQGEYYVRRIGSEKKNLDELEQQITYLSNQLILQKKELGGINATSHNTLQIQKQIRVLENRLDKALVKFNEALAYNKALRETIENLRRERLVFDQIYRKLERELEEKKEKLNEILEVSNSAYEARDAAQREMNDLKLAADEEQRQFEQQWYTLAAAIENDRKYKDFAANVPTSTGNHSNTYRIDNTTNDMESVLRKRVTKGAWNIAKDKANIHLSMEKVQAYEEAFAKIQKHTRITDIDELVNTFIQAEDYNFELYNTLNDLSAEEEKLETQIEDVKCEITKYTNNTVDAVVSPTNASAADEDSGDNKHTLITELQAKYAQHEQQLKTYEDQYANTATVLTGLKNGVSSIYQQLMQIESQALVNGVGSANGKPSYNTTTQLTNEEVTESNMMHYLGLIEQRTNELLHLYVLQRDADESMGGGMGNSHHDALSPMDVQIHAPSTLRGGQRANEDDDAGNNDDDDRADADDNEDSDDGEDVVPLSHEQLHAQVMAQ